MLDRVGALSPPVQKDTKRVGDVAEAQVLAALVRSGYSVSIPFGENNRYDIILDIGGELSRVQVKAGRLRDGAIIFNCYSSHSHRGGSSCKSYVGEVDYFAVYCAQNERVYLVPIADLATKGGSIRLNPTRNNQGKRVRWAQQYELS